jgi:hypothetical protein
MNRREKAALQRSSWRLAAMQLDKCRADAKELDRVMAGARRAALGAASFMALLTAVDLAPTASTRRSAGKD